MRLGELKNILDKIISEQNQFIVSVDSLYDGQRYRIKAYRDLIIALEKITEQSWVTADKQIIKDLIKGYGKRPGIIEVSPDYYSRLQALIDNINQRLPVFYGILEAIVPDQEEQVINIKIPENYVTDLNKLNEFNNELISIFKLVVLHKGLPGNEVRFQGFDVGTSWYQMLIIGAPVVYYGFMGVIEIAEKLIHLRQTWFESEDMRLAYEVKKQELEQKEANALTLEKFLDPIYELSMQESIEKLIQEIGDNLPDNKNEINAHILSGLKKIIKLIEKGTEFHPSLNLPEFIAVGGNDTSFVIDYEELKKSLEDRKEEVLPKQIENKEKIET